MPNQKEAAIAGNTSLYRLPSPALMETNPALLILGQDYPWLWEANLYYLDYPWLWEANLSVAGGSVASDLHPLIASSTPTFSCDN